MTTCKMMYPMIAAAKINSSTNGPSRVSRRNRCHVGRRKARIVSDETHPACTCQMSAADVSLHRMRLATIEAGDGALQALTGFGRNRLDGWIIDDPERGVRIHDGHA